MQTTRDTLLDLAERASCQRGFVAVSYGDLAKLADIRKASIHHHFPAKADLGAAMLDRYADRLAERLANISAHSRNGGEALRTYIADCRAALENDGGISLIAALACDAPRLQPDLRDTLAKAQRMIADWLSRTMQRGRQDRSISVSGNPDEEGLAVLVQLLGAQVAARSQASPTLFDAATATLSARMFRS